MHCSRVVSFVRSENTPDGRDVMALEYIEWNECWVLGNVLLVWKRYVNDVRPANAPDSREAMELE